MPRLYKGRHSLNNRDKKHAIELIKSGQAPTPKALMEQMPEASPQAIGGLFTAEARRSQGLDPLTGKIPQESPVRDFSRSAPPEPLPEIPSPGGNGNGSGQPPTSPETAAAAAAISEVPVVSSLPAASSVPVASIAPPPSPGRIAIWRNYGDPTGFLGEEPAPLDIPKIKERYGGGTFDFITYRPNAIPFHQKNITIAGPSKAPPVPEPSTLFRDRSPFRHPEGAAGGDTAGLLAAFATFQQLQNAAETRALKTLDAPDKKAEADGGIAKNSFDLVKGVLDRAGKDEGSMAALLRFQSEERGAAAERHKADLERMRTQAELDRTRDEKRADLEMQRERERAGNEIAREKERIAAQEQQNKIFFVEMQKIRDTQAELVRKELELQRTALTKEMEANRSQAASEHESIMGMAAEKKKEWDDFRSREMKHLEEVLTLKGSMGVGAHEIEMQKMWADTAKEIFARVERKVELLATAGQSGNRMPYSPGSGSSPQVSAGGKELSVSMADAIFKSQIFNDSIRLELDLNISSQAPAELFVNSLVQMQNMDGRMAVFVNYFFVRQWSMILADAQGRLPASSLRIWQSAYAQQWFDDVKAIYFAMIKQARVDAAASAAAPAAPVVPVVAMVAPEPPPPESTEPVSDGAAPADPHSTAPVQ